jgi:hypothetical protein
MNKSVAEALVEEGLAEGAGQHGGYAYNSNPRPTPAGKRLLVSQYKAWAIFVDENTSEDQLIDMLNKKRIVDQATRHVAYQSRMDSIEEKIVECEPLTFVESMELEIHYRLIAEGKL